MAKRVLMLDDEIPLDLSNPAKPTPYMWYYANALLKAKDLEVEFARTLEDAMQRFFEKRFDVVSIDIILPSDTLSETRNDTRSGLAFLSRIAETGVSTHLIILSLMGKSTLLSELPRERGGIKSVNVLEKIQTTPDDFVSHILRILNEDS